MSPPDEGQKISTFSRVLAWIFVIAMFVGSAGVVAEYFLRPQWSMNLTETLAMALGMLIYGSSFLFAAWTGRSPRWMTWFETSFDRESEKHARPLTTNRRSRMLMVAAQSAIVAVILIWIGNWLDLFAGVGAWFVIPAFAIAWLMVSAILWRQGKRYAVDGPGQSS